MPKPRPAPPPPVAPETWRALLAAASDFAALKPWEFACDIHAIGLTDAVNGEMRIANVLGNAGEVFAAVFYRRAGLRWILSMLSEDSDPGDLNNADGIDCLKLEFVPRRELWKEDLAVLKAAGFKPLGKGPIWPQFRSAEPGWHPWHINQAEADQLLAELPRVTAFYRMFEQHPDLFEGRGATELPFLPPPQPDRPISPGDLDWRPLLLPPLAGFEPYQGPPEQRAKLLALGRAPGLVCEFDCTLLPGGSFYENGRPCFGRFSLLVEKKRGLVIGMDVQSGAHSPGEATGRALSQALLMAKCLPERIAIRGSRLRSVLQPLCEELQIELQTVSSLPTLEEAVESLGQHMLAANGMLRP